MEVPQKITSRCFNFTFNYLSKEIEIRTLTSERINKMWCVHRVEYYPSLKKKDILPFVRTWMDMDDIMLSERK